MTEFVVAFYGSEPYFPSHEIKILTEYKRNDMIEECQHLGFKSFVVFKNEFSFVKKKDKTVKSLVSSTIVETQECL